MDLRITIKDEQHAFRPGDVVEGQLAWALDQEVKTLDLNLLWFTSGAGTVDAQVVETLAIPRPGRQGDRNFRFQLPEGPYSFSGKLITLTWALEAVPKPRGDAVRVEFTMSPTGTEVRI